MWISIWNSEISTATGIYCGSRKLRPWEIPPFTPWENTVAYYKLIENWTDFSWKWNNLSSNWTPVYTTVWNATYASLNSTASGNFLYTDSATWVPQWTSDRTVSCWFYKWSWTKSTDATIFMLWNAASNQMFNVFIDRNARTLWISQYGSGQWGMYTFTDNTWYHIVVTYSWTTWTVYVNWTNIGTWNYTIWTSWNKIYLMQWSWDSSTYCVWNLSEVIIENKARTAAEISTYYNKSKANYWL